MEPGKIYPIKCYYDSEVNNNLGSGFYFRMKKLD